MDSKNKKIKFKNNTESEGNRKMISIENSESQSFFEESEIENSQ